MATKKAESAKKPRASTTKSVKKAEAKPAPKKRGRKEWVPDYLMIEKLAGQLMTDKQIAQAIGMNPDVFCRKKGQLSQLKDTLAKGRSKTISACSNKILMAALDPKNPCLTSLRFILERKAGWKQHNVIEKKELKDMTTEELLELLENTDTE